jgi:hypothetical protein
VSEKTETVFWTPWNKVSIPVGIGVFWCAWGAYGFWWALLCGMFWEVWVGFRLAQFLVEGR